MNNYNKNADSVVNVGRTQTVVELLCQKLILVPLLRSPELQIQVQSHLWIFATKEKIESKSVDGSRWLA